MRLLLFLLTAAIVVTTGNSVHGQYSRETNPFAVTIEGIQLGVPFSGGLNNPKPTLIDFDRDGLLDLMIGEPSGKLIWLRNIGTVASPQWTGASQRLGGIDIGSWHTFCDIDADGDFDLFCDSKYNSAVFYRNDSDGDSLIFTRIDTAFGGFEVGTNNTPTFADIDNDGDFDFFHGAISGRLDFYRNEGDSANPSFTFVTDSYDSIIAFPFIKEGANPQHGFSNIRFVDIDNDNDLDLFFGDLFNPNLYYFNNLGDSVQSDLTLQTQSFLPEFDGGFNHTAFGDLDNDNDLDMMIGVNNGADLHSLRLYRNNGTPSEFDFVLEDSSLLEEIDVGSSSIPTFGDLDNDNDLDLLLGGSNGQLAYFENRGNRLTPQFELVSEMFAGIDVGAVSAPHLTDWDDDGDLDLLIGTISGYIQYWRNDGSRDDFQPVLVESQLAGIKVDQLASPWAVDLDNDGLKDLLVGEWDFNGSANVLLYENIGTPGSPALSLQTNRLLRRIHRDFTLPVCYDWNDDGLLDLIIGGQNLGLTLFLNTGSPGVFPDSLTLLPQADLLPGYDDGTRLAFVLADIDADGDRDVFLGEQFGGLNFYRHEGSCCQGEVGNIDGDPQHMVDIGDITVLINHMFITLTPVLCLPESNIDGDPEGIIDIGDLSLLITHLFITLAPLPNCP